MKTSSYISFSGFGSEHACCTALLQNYSLSHTFSLTFLGAEEIGIMENIQNVLGAGPATNTYSEEQSNLG